MNPMQRMKKQQRKQKSKSHRLFANEQTQMQLEESVPDENKPA